MSTETAAARKGNPAGSDDIILEVQDLKMYFPVTKGLLKRKVADVKAVDGVSFSIPRGTTLGLVGESGSGKSTIGNCIMANIKATEGSIRYNGQDVTAMDAAALKRLHREMTMITQNPFASLDPRMRIKDSILEGVRVQGLSKGKEADLELVRSLLKTVGLNPDFLNRFPHEFSGGQRQRISIARALALEPSLIVCDEIVSALDVSIQAQIVNLMIEIQKEKGLTYIFIGHDLSVVRHVSQTVAVLYLGKVMEFTESDELYNNPLHPYTQALLSAAPVPDPEVDRQRERILLGGEIPSPINPPAGCRFCTRCKYATEQCSMEEPPLVEVSPNHLVACHQVSRTEEAL